jgi:hypothetical protein
MAAGAATPSPSLRPFLFRPPRGPQVLALPAIPLTMTAGAIFGVPAGTAMVTISATLAATIAFLIARYVARDKVGPARGAAGRGAGGPWGCRGRQQWEQP